jgi:hypothetical protein
VEEIPTENTQSFNMVFSLVFIAGRGVGVGFITIISNYATINSLLKNFVSQH